MTEVRFDNLEELLEESTLSLKMGKVKKVIGLIIHAVGLKVFV
jgi:flagellum-specific ATP synthase